MIFEEIKQIKESPEDLRKFGLTVGIVLAIIAGVMYWNEKSSYLYFSIAASLLIISGIIFPKLLKPINKAWMALAVVLGWFMTRVILSILFYITITPISLLAKLFGKKFLNLKIDKSAFTYWEKRQQKNFDPLDYEKQF